MDKIRIVNDFNGGIIHIVKIPGLELNLSQFLRLSRQNGIPIFHIIELKRRGWRKIKYDKPKTSQGILPTETRQDTLDKDKILPEMVGKI